MIECKICKTLLKDVRSLGHHIPNVHKIKAKEYYDLYLKDDNDGKCAFCNNITRFINLGGGYAKYCCCKCAGFHTKAKLKDDTIKYNEFKKNCSNAVKNIWKDRSKEENIIIRCKIAESIKEGNSKLNKNELNEKYGWLNKFSSGLEKEIKIKEILDASLFKWWANASKSEKEATILKIRKTKLGERFNDNMMNEFISYKREVYMLTNRTYKKYSDEINPNNLKRSRTGFHLDHRYSIVQGFIDKIPPEIIASKFNLRIISAQENISKYIKCDIIKEDLYEQYEQCI